MLNNLLRLHMQIRFSLIQNPIIDSTPGKSLVRYLYHGCWLFSGTLFAADELAGLHQVAVR